MRLILSEGYLKTLLPHTGENSSKGREQLSNIFEVMFLESFLGGFEHAKIEVSSSREYFRKKLPDKYAEEGSEDTVPDQVVAWYRAYSVYLAGSLTEAISDRTQEIITESIQEGLHWRDIVKRLQESEELKGFAERRLQTIARTETTKGYNRGRLEQFKGTNGYVEAVQYSAVLDKRTTPICRRLHGRIMDINNSLVNVYLPPNHPNCRSIVLPVTRYDDWEESPFDDIPRPKKGFDNPEWRSEG